MRLLLLLLLLLPLACAKPVADGSDLAKVSRHFSEAMRWKDFHNAAAFLEASARSRFQEQFQEDEDLHVVESRIERIDFDQEAGTAEVGYLLEYYRLPSTKTKKWRWQQYWRLQNEQSVQSGVWRIENPPPDGL